LRLPLETTRSLTDRELIGFPAVSSAVEVLTRYLFSERRVD